MLKFLPGPPIHSSQLFLGKFNPGLGQSPFFKPKGLFFLAEPFPWDFKLWWFILSPRIKGPSLFGEGSFHWNIGGPIIRLLFGEIYFHTIGGNLGLGYLGDFSHWSGGKIGPKRSFLFPTSSLGDFPYFHFWGILQPLFEVKFFSAEATIHAIFIITPFSRKI